MKTGFKYIAVSALVFLISCTSTEPARTEITDHTGSGILPDEALADTESGISLDEALRDIASYYTESLTAGTKIALVNFESGARLLSDYILEELWIHFEDSRSFTMVDRQNLELIEKEMRYQYSGNVSDESLMSIGRQYGPQTLVYGSITALGGEYRLVIRATDIEKATTSIRRATVIPNRRFNALLESPSGDKEEAAMASALYTSADNPWQFSIQTDRSNGLYRDGEYMNLRIFSEKDAWFKITHIDVNGNAQVIYPVSPNDNNFIRAGQTRQIPDNTRFRMTQPYGEEIILAGAYESSFGIQPNSSMPLSNNLLVRSFTVEREDNHTEMRPVATASFTYRIEP